MENKIYKWDLEEKNKHKLLSKLKEYNKTELEKLKNNANMNIVCFKDKVENRKGLFKKANNTDDALTIVNFMLAAVMSVGSIISFMAGKTDAGYACAGVAGLDLFLTGYSSNFYHNKINKQIINLYETKAERSKRLVETIESMDVLDLGRNTDQQEFKD
jgi:ABC-type multidrug transport system fused ATPase/permease subunit